MSKDKTGGPAYPVLQESGIGNAGDTWYQVREGLTMRDVMAIAAMQAVIPKLYADNGYSGSEIAADAYDIADAMLRERDKPV